MAEPSAEQEVVMHTRQWHVEVFLSENEGRTNATARLDTGSGATLDAAGTARLNPVDRDVPEIGDELAAARALSALAHRLLDVAAEDIEGITHEPARLDR
ncbi:dsRBD fold-containing protein [Amycolatopsis sp. NPDC050768]|uniref:dsRBD fold-containing protein n=2 Tax=Amycolatopsis TaxID=1813 RepID=UPI00340E9273